MTKITIRMAGALAAALVLASQATAAPNKPEFVPMGDHDLVPIDITADGSTIAGIGFFGAPHFTWSRDGGYVLLGGGCGAGQPSINADGSVIVGCTIDEFGNSVAAKWIGGTDWQSLGSVEGAVPCGTDLSSSWDVDDAGTTAVGLVWLAQECRAHAGAWDLASAPPATDLGSLGDRQASRANAISGDGQVIAGWQDDEVGQRQGAKWVGGVESMVVTPAGEFVGEVMDVNSDGSAMVGLNYPFGSNDGWLWTAKSGFKAIASGLPLFSRVIPVGVSEDGSVVVGIVRDNNGNQKPFFYSKGKFTLGTDWLAKNRLAQGWSVQSFSLISRDGRKVAGWGINPDGFVEGFVIENF